MAFPDLLAEYRDNILETARWLHKNPELSNQEYQTCAFIRSELEACGIELLDYPLKTGVLALIRGAHDGPTIGLRADIDALPVAEDPQNPVQSCRPGIMHACGHDIHTAALLSAAKILHHDRKELQGQILLIFQPAEEVCTGAAAVRSSGVFNDYKPAAFFSLHVMPDIPEGQVSVQAGPIMAAQERFAIEVCGKGSHGAWPHLSHDSIIAAVDIVNGLQKVDSRMIDPLKPFVLSVCSIHGGQVFNIIPENCTVMGTCRYLHNELRDQLVRSIKAVAEHTASIYGCSVQVSFDLSLRANVNHSSLLSIAEESVKRAMGAPAIIKTPARMGSEDFSVFSEIAPTFMYHVGCGKGENSPALHSSRFQVSSDALLDCAALMTQTAATALDYLKLAETTV